MKKKEVENQLEEMIIQILRDNYKVTKDRSSDARMVIISDYRQVAKQIVKVVISDKIMKLLI